MFTGNFIFIHTYIKVTRVQPGEGVKAEGELAVEAPRQQHVPDQGLKRREERFKGIGERDTRVTDRKRKTLTRRTKKTDEWEQENTETGMSITHVYLPASFPLRSSLPLQVPLISQCAGHCVPAAPVLSTPPAGGTRPMPTCACVRSLFTRACNR